MNKGKFYSIMLLAVATSILFAPNYASAAESKTLKANISHTEKSLMVEFSDAPTIKGKSLQEATADTVQFLKDFFIFEKTSSVNYSEAEEAGFVNQFDSSKISLNATEKSVEIKFQDNLAKTINKGFLRISFYIDLNSVKDADGNTLSGKSTGSTNNLKTKSTRRIRIDIRAKYNKDLELNPADTETYVIIPGSDESWKGIQASIKSEMKAEEDAAKQAKDAKQSGDVEKIKASNENVAKLLRKSSVEALTLEVPSPKPPVDPIIPEKPKNPAEPAQPVEPAQPAAPASEGKKMFIGVPNTGVQKENDGGVVLAIAIIALTSATYIGVKKF